MPENYPATIKAIMDARGWTTRQFADHLGVSPRTASGWLIGRRPGVLARKAIDRLAKSTKYPT